MKRRMLTHEARIETNRWLCGSQWIVDGENYLKVDCVEHLRTMCSEELAMECCGLLCSTSIMLGELNCFLELFFEAC